MKFFSKEQKELALKVDGLTLEGAYKDTEKKLRFFAYRGDEKMMKEIMVEHRLIEYALLYKLTPEYKEIIKKVVKK